MLRLLSTCLVAAGLTLGSIGCNKSPEGGQTGRQTANDNDNEKTFTVSGPTLETNLKPGEKKAIDLTLNRDDNFTSKVTFTAEEPKGIQVNFPKNMFEPKDGEKVQMMVTAEKDAVPGEKTITITAKPETGSPTSLQVKVEVEKSDAAK
jgi:uncharacterized membrane protein